MVFDEIGNPSGTNDAVELVLPQRAPAPSGIQDVDILPQVPLQCRSGEFRALDHDHRPVCIPKPHDWIDCPLDEHHVLDPSSGKPVCVSKSVKAICTSEEVQVCNGAIGECWCEPDSDNLFHAHGDEQHNGSMVSNAVSFVLSVYLIMMAIACFY